MDIEDIEGALQVFSRKDLQTVVTVKTVMDREGISFKDLEDYLKVLTRRIKDYNRKQAKAYKKRVEEFERQKEEWKKRTDRCPVCGEPLMLTRVRAPKGSGNVHGYRSVWYCIGESCTYEKYSKAILEDLYHEVMKREVE